MWAAMKGGDKTTETPSARLANGREDKGVAHGRSCLGVGGGVSIMASKMTVVWVVIEEGGRSECEVNRNGGLLTAL